MRGDLETFLGAATTREKRQLITQTNEMFAKERKDLRSIVENITRGSLMGHSPATLLARSGSGGSSMSIPAVVQSTGASVTTSVLSTSSGTSAQVGRPRSRVRDPLLAGAVAAAACAAFALVTMSGTARVSSRAPTVAAADLTPLSATPVRSRVRHVRVEAASAPLVATVANAILQPAPATVAAATPAPAAPEPAVKPAYHTIPSVLPPRSGRGPRLNVDTGDPWNENASK
jgi:hypothetical protein